MAKQRTFEMTVTVTFVESVSNNITMDEGEAEDRVKVALEGDRDVSNVVTTNAKETTKLELGDPEIRELDFERYGPGKFANNMAEHLYGLSLEGVGEECGDVDGYGHHVLLKDVDLSVKNFFREGKHIVIDGAIVSTSSDGMVVVNLYEKGEREVLRVNWRSFVEGAERFEKEVKE